MKTLVLSEISGLEGKRPRFFFDSQGLVHFVLEMALLLPARTELLEVSKETRVERVLGVDVFVLLQVFSSGLSTANQHEVVCSQAPHEHTELVTLLLATTKPSGS